MSDRVDKAAKWPVGGCAPGLYYSGTLCQKCGEHFMAAKRSYVCADCTIQSLLAERDALAAELETMRSAGIIEVAVRNPRVMEYMEHWEGRAEKAEAENQRLRAVFAHLDRHLSSLPDEPVSVDTVDHLCAILHGAALTEQEKTDAKG